MYAMATFDQRGQTVNNQYNAGRDINFGAANSREDVVQELKSLLSEVTKATQAGAIQEEAAVDVEANVRKAIIHAEKPEPDKKSILDYLTAASGVLKGIASATGLMTGLAQAAEAVRRLF